MRRASFRGGSVSRYCGICAVGSCVRWRTSQPRRYFCRFSVGQTYVVVSENLQHDDRIALTLLVAHVLATQASQVPPRHFLDESSGL